MYSPDRLPGLELVIVAACVFATVASCLVIPICSRVESVTRSWHPAARHRTLLLLALLPAALTAGALTAAVLPSALQLLVTGSDHCATHDDTHAHLCLVHPPHGHVSKALEFLAAALIGSRAPMITRVASGLYRRHVVARRLLEESVPTSHSFRRLDSAERLCLSVGILHPQLVVSKGLLRGMRSDELATVKILHHAAAARRDALTLLIARVATNVFPIRLRAELLAEIELAGIRACDERAASEVGRALVSSTVVAIGTKSKEARTATRVEALRASALMSGDARLAYALFALILVALAVRHADVHHTSESALSWMGGLHRANGAASE